MLLTAENKSHFYVGCTLKTPIKKYIKIKGSGGVLAPSSPPRESDNRHPQLPPQLMQPPPGHGTRHGDNRKVGEGGRERHLPAACTKYAKYKSSSLTETPIWWGCTHSPGVRALWGLYKALAISTFERNTFK